METSHQYNNDVLYYKDFSLNLSTTSEELLVSIEDILTTIDGVASAAIQCAEGTSAIANRVSDVNAKSNDVLDETLKAKASSEKLKEEISKFKI